MIRLLLVAVTLPVTGASCERSFSKMKLVKTFPRNSTTSEIFDKTDLLQIWKYKLKNIDDFVDGFDSRHDNRRIKLHDTKIKRRLCRDLCENSIAHCLFVESSWFRSSACFAYDKTVINQHRFEQSAFEDQSEKNSVLITKWTTLFGIFCKISFTPAVASCCHVHALNADAHLSAVLLCCATYAETSQLLTVYCIE